MMVVIPWLSISFSYRSGFSFSLAIVAMMTITIATITMRVVAQLHLPKEGTGNSNLRFCMNIKILSHSGKVEKVFHQHRNRLMFLRLLYPVHSWSPSSLLPFFSVIHPFFL